MGITFVDGVSEVELLATDIGTITATQISGGITASQITSASGAAIISAITSTQITGGITATQITTASAGAITGQLTASQGGTGLSSLTNGYVIVGNGSTTLGSGFHSNRMIAYGTGLLFNATGDTALSMNLSSGVSYIARRVTLANPIASLSTILPAVQVYTASAAGGSAVTATFVFVGLSATNLYLDQTVSLASTTISSSQLWVNVSASATSVAAAQVWVFGDLLVN